MHVQPLLSPLLAWGNHLLGEAPANEYWSRRVILDLAMNTQCMWPCT